MNEHHRIKSGNMRTRRTWFGCKIYEIELVVVDYQTGDDERPPQKFSYWTRISKADWIETVAAKMRGDYDYDYDIDQNPNVTHIHGSGNLGSVLNGSGTWVKPMNMKTVFATTFGPGSGGSGGGAGGSHGSTP